MEDAMQETTARQRILIVDDTPENLDILGELLKDCGRISVATSGEKAIEIARSKDPPDLILLDVMMPGMDGFDVCRRLKANETTKDIPVIFVTTLDRISEQMSGFDVGAVDYITKPFHPQMVRARAMTQLALKAARDTLRQHADLLEVRVEERTAQLREALRQVKEGSLETIVRLARAAEFKDDDTGAHVLRTSQYAAAIARKLGRPEPEVENLLHAAPMHDIGKIGIPDRILLKPAKLDEDEWRIMRRHCHMGAQILVDSESEVIRLGETVALTHHEKWDGTGYPRRMKGTDIPLVGRITAIADVFDALTTKRPYKEPFPVDRSFSILREGRENHFDPDVVDAFFQVTDEILAIREKYQDANVSHLFKVAEHGED